MRPQSLQRAPTNSQVLISQTQIQSRLLQPHASQFTNFLPRRSLLLTHHANCAEWRLSTIAHSKTVPTRFTTFSTGSDTRRAGNIGLNTATCAQNVLYLLQTQWVIQPVGSVNFHCRKQARLRSLSITYSAPSLSHRSEPRRSRDVIN